MEEGKGGKERGRAAERKGAARGVVAVGWCGELRATMLPAQAARTRAMREESKAGASKMLGMLESWCGSGRPARRGRNGALG